MIEKIGSIVATEVHGLSTWSGPTETFWVTFDIDPRTVPIGKLREHITAVHEYANTERPDGAIWIIAFVAQPEKRSG